MHNDPARFWKRCRDHLQEANEAYLQHLKFALSVGSLMVLGGLACILHGVLPGLYRGRASRLIKQLDGVLNDRADARKIVATGGVAAGLLTLALLSIAAASIPWFLETDPSIATSLSFLALGFPLAALRAGSGAEASPSDVFDLSRPRVGVRPPGAPAARSRSAQEVTIVGSGFTGTMVAIQLLKQGSQKVTLVERRDAFARGLPYSSIGGELLNVRASRMSAFPDDAAHFARWLARKGLGAPDDFVPRRVYGQYLADLLSQAWTGAGDRLRLVRGDAVDIEADGERAAVICADGRSLASDLVVLALGNLPPQLPSGLPADLPSQLYASDPWSFSHKGLSAADTVLLIGTGLTMIDAALQLEASGFEGKIVALSRRGLLPRAHSTAGGHAEGGTSLAGRSLSTMVRSVRRRSVEIGWHAAVDELRPFTHGMWLGASDGERERFLRHLRPWWDVHRHRVAPALAEDVQRLIASGRLEVVSGSVRDVKAAKDRAQVTFRPRGSSDRRTIDVTRIVNCTGPSGDISKASQPLIEKLLQKGMIRADRQRLGIEVDAERRVVQADGSPSPGLFAVGPIARGRLWEVTAVPDLRVEASAIARSLKEAEAGQDTSGPSRARW
jgi:uncharacterized NAD(P)/FAD-binding protein YdhS